MSATGGILVGILIGLVTNEIFGVTPWAARRLVRWSAYRTYAEPALALLRAEEWAAVIDARPGNLLKLFTALAFTFQALGTVLRRATSDQWHALPDRTRLTIRIARRTARRSGLMVLVLQP